MRTGDITTIFLDIGGVLLTNSWDKDQRKKAIKHFQLDEKAFEDRHHLIFDTYELGKMTLDEYLDKLIFYRKRTFGKEEFKGYIFQQSHAHQDVIIFFQKLKDQFRLQVVAINNEGCELNEYRIQKFKLKGLFDAFITSCYVHLRKPDTEIFRLACQLSQTLPTKSLYIDDRNIFVEVARSLGINGYHYQGLDAAKDYLKKKGLYIKAPGNKKTR